MKEIELLRFNSRVEKLLTECRNAVSNSQVKEIKSLLSEIPKEVVDKSERINIVFAGQYSAGKSSILKELTGKHLAVGGGITTEKCSSFEWNGLWVTDTPGIHTQNRPDHDAITYDAIAKADLIVFVITAEGFSEHLGKHFRKLIVDKDKGHEMMIVVNKMADSENGNTLEFRKELYKKDIAPVIEPLYSEKDMYISYIDMLSLNDSKEVEDKEERNFLLKEANWDDFINKLNLFVKDKNILGRYTTSLYKLEQTLSNIIDDIPSGDNTIDGFVHMLNEQRNMLIETRSNILSRGRMIVHSKTDPIIMWGNEVANKLTSNSNEKDVNGLLEKQFNKVNDVYGESVKELQKVIEEELKKLESKFKDFSVSPFIKDLQLQYERAFNDFKSGGGTSKSNQIVQCIANFGVKASEWGQNTNKVTGWESFLKLGTYSGSKGHEVILTVGHFFGYKFRPWEAVNIAAKISKVGKVLGVAGAVAGVVLQLWQDHKEQIAETKLNEARSSIVSSFNDAADVINMRFDEDTNCWVEENINSQIADLDSKMGKFKNLQNSNIDEMKLFTELRERTHELIKEIHG